MMFLNKIFRKFRTHNSYVVIGPTFNKSLEMGGCIRKERGPDFHCSFRTKGDHAGLKLHAGFFKFFFEFSVTDCRHWDYDKDCWVKYA